MEIISFIVAYFFVKFICETFIHRPQEDFYD